MQIEYSVVLPSYLEEENLRLLLPRLRENLEKLPASFEILVIDTPEPRDNTEEVCKKNHAVCIRRGPGSSFGDAVRSGIQCAKGKWIIFMDADGSHSPEFIPSFLPHTLENDVVIASRYVDGGYSDNKPVLILMSRVLNFSYSFILNLKYKDISNSFKIYRSDWLKQLKLHCQNFDIIQEILFKLKYRHPELRVKEIPFSFKQRMFGETKRNLAAFMVTYLFTMIKLRLSIFFEKP